MQLSKQFDEIADRRLSVFIAYSFLLVAINRVATLPFAESSQRIVALAQWGIYLFLFLVNLKYILKRANSVFTSSYIIFIVLYACSILYSLLRSKPIDLILSHEVVWTLFYFIPVGVATYSIRNYRVMYDMLYKVSYVISFLCIFYCVYRLFINPFGNSYDMAFGYILLVPTLLHIAEFKKTHKLLILLVIIIEIVSLLIFGSRGVVIGIVSYLFLDLFLKIKTWKDRIKLILPILALLLVYVELPRINDYLESQNIYSRTLIKLATGDEDDETHGRTNHWEVGMDLVFEHPIIGYGLGGYYYDFHEAISKKYPDELYTYDLEQGAWVKASAGVSGAHSGFIDMLLFFGVLIGIPLALWLLFVVFKLKKINNEYIFDILLVFYCSHILGNMIVGSGIHTKPGCAIFIYMMIKVIRQQKSLILIRDKN